MTVNPSLLGGFAAQFFDNNGVILSGGKIYTYAAGTTTPQATYTSVSGATPHANPIILDSAGRVPGGELWLTDGLGYKIVIETSLSVLIGTYDNVFPSDATLRADLAASGGAALVGSTRGTVQSQLDFIYSPNQTTFPYNFAYGDGLRLLVDDPAMSNVSSNNHAFGLGALLNLTGVSFNANPNAGYGNCAFGPKAMRDAINAFDNTAMGYECMYFITDGHNNQAYGPKALYRLTQGYRNIGIGTTAGFEVTTGYENTFVGHSAAFNATTANRNDFFGCNSGLRVTTASLNVSVGHSSFGGIAAAATTGVNNVAGGYRSLGSITTGTDNSAWGKDTGVSITTGSSNCLFGSTSGQSLVTASGNCAFGIETLFTYTGASASVFGTAAFRSLTSGQNATGFGYEAGKAFTTGNNNTVGGYRSFYVATTGSGNTGWGRLSGATITTGGNCTFIGDTADGIAAADNQTAIGAGATTTKADQVVIGNASVTETVLRGYVKSTTYAVAGLVAAATAGAGARAFVTDASATTFASVVAGGGANGVPVYSDGTNWRIG